MIDYDLLSILTSQEIEEFRKIEAIDESIAIANKYKDLVFDAVGNIPGVSDYKYTDGVASKVSDYMSFNMTRSVKEKITDVLGTDEAKIRKYTNQANSLMKLYGSYKECGDVMQMASKLWDGGNVVTSVIKDVTTSYGLDSAFETAKDILGVSMEGSMSNITSFVDNNFGSGVSGVVGDVIGGLFGSSGNSSGGIYGDKIPNNRELMVLTIQNITTGNIYKSIRFDDSFSDSHNADWDKQAIVGRTAQLAAFNSSSSTISISIKVLQDLLNTQNLESNLNVLRDLVNPSYVGNVIKKPVAKIFFGGLSRTVIFDSVDIEYVNYMIRDGKHTMANVSLSASVIGKSGGSLYSAGNY